MSQQLAIVVLLCVEVALDFWKAHAYQHIKAVLKSLITIYHIEKEGGNRIRGESEIRAFIDTVVENQKNDD